VRRFFLAAGLVLVALGATLLLLFSQTEVLRRLRQGAVVHVGVVALDPEGQPGTVGVLSLLPNGRVQWVIFPLGLAWPTSPTTWSPLSTFYASEGVEGVVRRLGSCLEEPVPYWVVVKYSDLGRWAARLGGVAVRVKERLVYQDRPRDLFLDLGTGIHTLGEDKVLAYLLVGEGGESGKAARHLELLRGFSARLGALPWNQAKGQVPGLLKDVRTNLTVWEAIDVLRVLRSTAEDRLETVVVPTVVRGEGKPEVVLDLVRWRKLLRARFGGPDPFTRDEVRVVVLNGTGVRLLARRAGQWLADRGFQVVKMDDADRANYPRTVVVVREETRAKAGAVLEVLSPVVPPPGVLVQTEREFGVERVGGWPKEGDVLIILGAGFNVPS